jgi:hypothetical protein
MYMFSQFSYLYLSILDVFVLVPRRQMKRCEFMNPRL